MNAQPLTEVPIVGQYYNVLCICVPVHKHAEWRLGHEQTVVEGGIFSKTRRVYGKNNVLTADLWLPIIGTRHTDPDIGMPLEHLHYDFRFISPKYRVKIGLVNHSEQQTIVPIHYGECDQGMRPRRCWQSHAVRFTAPKNLEHEFGPRKMTCAVCPHQGTPLHTVAPVDGKITCPAHGLIWDVVTGKLVRKWPYGYIDAEDGKMKYGLP